MCLCASRNVNTINSYAQKNHQQQLHCSTNINVFRVVWWVKWWIKTYYWNICLNTTANVRAQIICNKYSVIIICTFCVSLANLTKIITEFIQDVIEVTSCTGQWKTCTLVSICQTPLQTWYYRLLSNIILTGGNSRLNGLPFRLVRDLEAVLLASLASSSIVSTTS